jgi:uncharacterized repeat protein (TIGR01451 family)
VDVEVSTTTDLALGVIDSPHPVAPGATLTYALHFSNPGAITSPATNLVMPLPAGTSFVSADGGGALTSGVVQWSVGALAPGATGTRQLVTTVSSQALNGTLINAAADLRDPAAGRSMARATAATPVLASGNAQIGITATPDPVRSGQLVQYAVTATNVGSTLQTYSITARVPNNTVAPLNGIGSFYSWSCGGSNGGSCPAGSTIQWGAVNIAAGQSATVTFAALVDVVNPPPNGTVLHATASVAGNGTAGSATAAVDVEVR